MLTIVYLCRHAAYENPRQIFHGRLAGFPLSVKGRRQAKALACALKGRPIAAVYASPLTRAYQTAKIIAKLHDLRVATDKRLMDIKTPFQGKPLSRLHAIGFDVYQHRFTAAGGEHLSEIFQRMNSFMREKIKRHQGQQIVAVSHGDPVMAVKFKYLGRPLYSRKPFDKEYLGVGECLRLTFDQGMFRKLKPLDL